MSTDRTVHSTRGNARPQTEPSNGHLPQSTGVVVVGAGPAGLATAAELERRGQRTIVLEASDAVGSRWRGTYDRLRLNTSRFTSRLGSTPYAERPELFPTREQFVDYLENVVEDNGLDVRLGTGVQRIDRQDGRWRLSTPAGQLVCEHVVVATGYAREPTVPPWPGRDDFAGELIHSSDYRRPDRFRGRDVLVVGPGSSGFEIAYDLAEGGAARVRLAVRTPPNILLRSVGGLPGDVPATAMLRLPPKIADGQLRLARRLSLGDLSPFGLPAPDEGPFARSRRLGASPAVVDPEVLEAVKTGRIEVVSSVASLDATGVELTDGRRIEPDAVIAATGFRAGLEGLVGHLGVLDPAGVPRVAAGLESAPGLRFVGFDPVPAQLRRIAMEARRAAREIARQGETAQSRGQAPGLYGAVFAALYDPILWLGERAGMADRRSEVLSRARGRVLELGAGTGLNLDHYPDEVEELVLSEPDPSMAGRLQSRLERHQHDGDVVPAPAESLPFDDDTFDTVVSTFVLCTVDDPRASLREVRRVLRPGGQLLFIEHVRAEDERLARWQDLLHRPWRRFACGCHDNRSTHSTLLEEGFDVDGPVHSSWRGMPPLVKPLVSGRATAA